MATNGTTESAAPEFLYHIKRTITDFHEDKSGATRTTDILGTFTDLKAAKAAAYSALASEGYIKDDFELYEENTSNPEAWKHGDGVLAFAKAPAGQEFDVRLDTKPNVLKLKGNASGEVDGFLHYGKSLPTSNTKLKANNHSPPNNNQLQQRPHRWHPNYRSRRHIPYSRRRLLRGQDSPPRRRSQEGVICRV